MPTYKELLAHRKDLDVRIEAARQAEMSTAIARARDMITEFGLTPEDVFGKPSRTASAAKGKPVAPKYRDPATGSTWSGRGKPPKWIAGDADRKRFAI